MNDVKSKFDSILGEEKVNNALQYLKDDDNFTLEEQLELCQIPSPSFSEQKKGELIAERMKEYGLINICTDDAGNVIGTREGIGNGPKIVVSSHMDTVFPMETDLSVKKDGDIYRIPGICDANRSLAELLSVLRALENTNIETIGDIIFCMTVGEEANGDLYGSRHFFKTRNDIDAFITVDTSMAHGIVYKAQGGASYKVKFKGSGGHGFLDFGTPNANNALGRAVTKLADMPTNKESNTTFNVGIIEGGEASNAISGEAFMTLSLRSDDEENLKRIQDQATSLLHEAVVDENNRWDSANKVFLEIELASSRPAGSQPDDAPIVEVLKEANRVLGLDVILATPASTDANIPMHKGIPALAIGHGGIGGGVHSTDEWFSPVNAYLGPQRAMLAVLALAGINDCCNPIKLK